MKTKMKIALVLLVVTLGLNAKTVELKRATMNNSRYFSEVNKVPGLLAQESTSSVYRPNIKEFNSSDFMLKVKPQFQKLGSFKNVNLLPKALYDRPQGTYPYSLMGLSAGLEVGLSYSYQAIAGSAFSTPWTFRNLSSDATSYSWDWGTDVNYSLLKDASFKIDELNFLLKGYYYAPLLKSINGVDTSYYALADLEWEDGVYPSRMAASAESAYLGLPDFYGNTAEQNSSGMSFWLYSDPDGSSLDLTGDGYVFGSCRREFDNIDETTIANTRTNEVIVVYEKPMSPLVVKDLTYLIYSASANPIPVGKGLQLSVVKVDAEGKLTEDTIASTQIYSTDVVSEGNNFFYIPAIFYDTDPETGREMQTPIRIDTEFAVVLAGLDQDGVNFGMFSDYGNKTDNSSFFGKVNEDTGEFYGYFGSSDTNGINVYLSLNAYFDYLYTDEASRTLFVGKEGGYAVDSLGQEGGFVYSFFEDVTDSITGEPLIWVDDTEIPEWLELSYDNSYYDEYQGLVFYLQASELPVGMTERTADVNIYSFGAQASIQVVQAINSANTTVIESGIRLSSVENGYNLSYPQTISSITLYDTFGRIIANEKLDGSGLTNVTLPQKGVYLLRLSGVSDTYIKLHR